MKDLAFSLCIVGLIFAAAGAIDSLPSEIISPIDGAPMVLIPAGEFVRGTTESQVAEVLRIDPSLYIKLFKFKAEQPLCRIYLSDYYNGLNG